MPSFDTENVTITDVRHLPIVKAYAIKIGLLETIDQMVDTQMELSPGMVLLGMVLDTLSGRTPLYRLTEFLKKRTPNCCWVPLSHPNGFAIKTWGDRWIRSSRPDHRRSSLSWPRTP